MELSSWPKMQWQELVFDLQSLRLCIDSIAAILSMVCVPQPSVTLRSHNLSSSLP